MDDKKWIELAKRRKQDKYFGIISLLIALMMVFFTFTFLSLMYCIMHVLIGHLLLFHNHLVWPCFVMGVIIFCRFLLICIIPCISVIVSIQFYG